VLVIVCASSPGLTPGVSATVSAIDAMGGRASTAGEVGCSFARVGDSCGRLSVSKDGRGTAGPVGTTGECGAARVAGWIIGEMTTAGLSSDGMGVSSLTLAPFKIWSVYHFRIRDWPYHMWRPRRCEWKWDE
jgi:hypothetical protein